MADTKTFEVTVEPFGYNDTDAWDIRDLAAFIRTHPARVAMQPKAQPKPKPKKPETAPSDPGTEED